MPLDISTVGVTDIGMTRMKNDDSVLVAAERGLAVVADGMGGAPAGDAASSIAVDAVEKRLADWGEGSGVSAEGFQAEGLVVMNEAVQDANARILDAAAVDPERRGMGTTVTALQVHPETGAYVIGHVGDSRAYRVSGDGLEQLTTDQTWVQSQVDMGTIRAEDAENHPLGHILSQAVGTDPSLTPQLVEGTAAAGDLFLLCTDGVVKMLGDDGMERVIRENRGVGLETLARAIVDAANEEGGHDNVTIALLRVD